MTEQDEGFKTIRIEPDLTGLDEAMDRARRSVGGSLAGLSLAFKEMANQLAAIQPINFPDTIRNLAPKSPSVPAPLNPALAALEARRCRNTGPQRHQRARKNIGWGRP